MTRFVACIAVFTFSTFAFAGLTGLTPSTHATDIPIVGVTEIKAPVDDRYWRTRLNTKAENFQVMLETQLSKVGRFTIIERNRVDEILTEQGLNNAVGDGKTANGGFNIAGVDYLVYGSITDFSQTKKTVGGNQFHSEKVFTEMTVDIKIVDAQSGEVRLAETVTEQIQSGDSLKTRQFSNSDVDKSPLTKIQRQVAKKLAGVIATTIFPIEVLKGGDVIYINYGDAVLDKGDQLKIYRQGERLIDRSTGLDLGAEEAEVALLEVIEVNKKFAKAKLVTGATPAEGDIARLFLRKAGAANADKKAEKRGRKI